MSPRVRRPRRDPEDDDERLGDEELEEGQEGVEESDLFAPPGDQEYDHIRYFEGLRELPAPFRASEELTRRWLGQRLAAFAVRFSGGDRQTGAHDPQDFTRRIMRAAQLNRWVSNSAYSRVGYPGVLATVPGSLIAHFTVAPGEEPLRLGRHREYPSISGARAVARLLAYADDEERLLAAIHPLGKRAVNVLLATFVESLDAGVTVNWLSREGQYARLTPRRAEEGAETLNVQPRMVRRPAETIVGSLDRPAAADAVVRFQPLRGGPKLLHYRPAMREKIRADWGRYIVGSMVVEEPENPSLPRAPARVRHLVRIAQVYDRPEEIPGNLL